MVDFKVGDLVELKGIVTKVHSGDGSVNISFELADPDPEEVRLRETPVHVRKDFVKLVKPRSPQRGDTVVLKEDPEERLIVLSVDGDEAWVRGTHSRQIVPTSELIPVR